MPKRYLNMKKLFYSICLTLMIPYIPLTQNIKNSSLRLGFPYKFYTIHINTENTVSIHFGIAGFILNVFIMKLL